MRLSMGPLLRFGHSNLCTCETCGRMSAFTRRHISAFVDLDTPLGRDCRLFATNQRSRIFFRPDRFPASAPVCKDLEAVVARMR